MTQNRFREQFFAGAPRYTWLETLGRGGMGIVYKARDLDLDDVVAIKVLQPDFDGSELDLLTRFKREINLNRKIKHPNVARIHDFGVSGDYPFITMEFIAGKDLKALIQEKGRLTSAEAVPILRQIARGTQAAHEVGIIHRDLKPQNVMVDETGAVAILDFGLARGKLNTALTAHSVVLGTPHYISPEQALGNQADARSDVYAIGIIAFETLTGELPFVGDTPVATAMKQVTDPVPGTLLAYHDVSPELRALVHRCLSKRPEERFQTAAELEMELALLELAPQFLSGPLSGATTLPGSSPALQPRAARLGPSYPGQQALPQAPQAPQAVPYPQYPRPPQPQRPQRPPSPPQAPLPPPQRASSTQPSALDADLDARVEEALDSIFGRRPSPAAPEAAPPRAPSPRTSSTFLDAEATATPRIPHRVSRPRPPAPETARVPSPAPLPPPGAAPPPRPPAAAQAPSAPPAAPRPAGETRSGQVAPDTIIRKRPPTVLIVDADDGGLGTSAGALEEAGCKTVLARTGPEALDILTRRTVDLVLIDASLPGMDGFDVTRILKAQPDLAEVPVLLASTRVDRKIYSFGMSVGAADVIRKPVTPGFVAWRAWQLLGRRGFRPPSGVILRGGGSAPVPG